MHAELMYGKVESIEDSDKLGRIQVRCVPEMSGFVKDDLPWLRPFLQQSMTTESSTLDLPEEGSYVWCIFLDPFFKDGWYLSGVFIDGKFDFTSIADDLKSKIEGLSTQSYGDLRFSRYEDGTIVFWNSTTKEYGVLHSSGSYTLFDKDGAIQAYSGKTVKISTDKSSFEIDESGNIIVSVSGSGTVQLAGDGDNLVTYTELKAILEGICRNLDARMMVDPLSGMTGSVNPGMLTDTFDPMKQSNLLNMKTTKIKAP